MRIHEITNPEDQLALLKLIMNNTWSAIASQVQSTPKIPNKGIAKKKVYPPKKALRKVPFKSPPKPTTPQKTPTTTASPVPNQSLHNPLATKPTAPKVNNLGGSISRIPIGQDRSDKEYEELIKLIRGEKPIKSLK